MTEKLIDNLTRLAMRGSYSDPRNVPIVVTASPLVAVELIQSLCEYRYVYQSLRRRCEIWKNRFGYEGEFNDLVPQLAPQYRGIVDLDEWLHPYVKNNIAFARGQLSDLVGAELSGPGGPYGNVDFRDLRLIDNGEWRRGSRLRQGHTLVSNVDHLLRDLTYQSWQPNRPGVSNPHGRRPPSLDMALNYKLGAGRAAANDVHMLHHHGFHELVFEHLCCLWMFKQLIVVSQPPTEIHTDEGMRIHRTDGPAITWRDGLQLSAVRGIYVDNWKMAQPDKLTVNDVFRERNQEVRSALMELVGYENIVNSPHATKRAEDEFGKLWRIYGLGGHGGVNLVEVVNSTAEPDGTYKTYFLRVPPHVSSPREAIAWTFGLESASLYAPAVET